MLHALKQCLNTVQVICRICAFESLYAYIYIYDIRACVFICKGDRAREGMKKRRKKGSVQLCWAGLLPVMHARMSMEHQEFTVRTSH